VFDAPAGVHRPGQAGQATRAGEDRTGADAQHVGEEPRPQGAIDRRCGPCGVLARPRPRHLGMVVRALVIAAGTPGGADPAAVRRSSLAWEGPQGARAAG
jgi:hypothetical protein